MSKNDGGAAFPQHILETRDGAWQCSYDAPAGGGMSLRDYFAAQALVRMVREYDRDAIEEGAALCYEWADAMLAERAK